MNVRVMLLFGADIIIMKKSELQDALLELLFTGPEWQYDRFVRSLDL